MGMLEVSKFFWSGRYPCYNIYETKDGEYASLGAFERRFWATLCQKLDREDLIPLQFDEGEKRGGIFQFRRETFKSKTREEWMEELKDLDVCFGKVLHLEEAFNDPQVRHRRMVTEFVDRQKGKIKLLSSPI